MPPHAQQDIDAGKHVISQEIKGLEALRDTLDNNFSEAVELIHSISGRVIISGMGKSGHIGHKIAATFASTGTPAFFVHPGEASHGDLGMITEQDVLIVLSNSGKTSELTDIIQYAKRFDIPLIAMVRRQPSDLTDAASVSLVLPEIAEASSVDAPTTSTTMMLALGDALAAALMERRGFDIDNFRTFHPGGKLGSAFLRVKDLMHTDIPKVSSDTLMSDVLIEITSKSFGCTAVVDNAETLEGIVTDGDLRRHMEPDLLKKQASYIMTQDPVTIVSTALASEALHIMETKSITALFIVEENKPIGIIHIHDILKAGVA